MEEKQISRGVWDARNGKRVWVANLFLDGAFGWTLVGASEGVIKLRWDLEGRGDERSGSDYDLISKEMDWITMAQFEKEIS